MLLSLGEGIPCHRQEIKVFEDVCTIFNVFKCFSLGVKSPDNLVLITINQGQKYGVQD